MVVPRELRDLGVGSAALRAVEDLAQSEGFGTVRVWPRPLDNSFDQEGLERWYRERGYKTVPDGTGDREKRIIPVSPDNNFRSFCELNRGFRVISTEWTDYSRKVFQNSTKALENVVGAKSVEDAIEVQTKYAKEAYEAHTAELKKLGEMYASLIDCIQDAGSLETSRRMPTDVLLAAAISMIAVPYLFPLRSLPVISGPGAVGSRGPVCVPIPGLAIEVS